MHHFWEINELIIETFAFLEPGDLFHCAQVSKRLSVHALDSLYRELEGLYNVLSILSPINPPRYPRADQDEETIASTDDYTFAKKSLSEDDWLRFQHYAQRVHQLDCDWMGNGYNIPLITHDLQSVTLPDCGLFPNLKSLRWTGHHLPAFENLRIGLSVSLRELMLQAASPVIFDRLPEVLQCCPELESVTLLLDYPQSHTADELPTFEDDKVFMMVTSLPKLKELHLDPPLVSAETLTSISRKPSLTSLIIASCPALPRKIPLPPLPACPLVESDNYPALRELCLSLPPGSQKVPESYAGCPISSLLVDASGPSTDNLSNLLQDFRQFRNLRHLVIIFSFDQTSTDEQDAVEDDTILSDDAEQYLTFDMLRPLLSLSLVVFEASTSPFFLLDREIEEMARCWPDLESLCLCTPQADFSEGTEPEKIMPISSLEIFGRHFRNLKNLRLYVDATVVPPLSEDVAERHVFDCLLQLDLRGSKVEKPCDVALYLAEILPQKCELVKYDGWTYEFFVDDMDYGWEDETARDVWDEIGILFTGMQTFRLKVLHRLWSRVSSPKE
ncbi:hypothetical protein SISSUDRAFT_209019 [Sistotremastrum suecicum HHB10207 ss-3]|uniref:F-box domain-containing protein n=1 Tax=Sistotremastrum suecicum HHB10207 ss-3 TaxID=1314776 RepID=A0A166GN55_9AGAM|nr:hypothetical protein SISSUDRAFT_209019 [Sistotremastrum suecicum HHB10207 ss-3]